MVRQNFAWLALSFSGVTSVCARHMNLRSLWVWERSWELVLFFCRGIFGFLKNSSSQDLLPLISLIQINSSLLTVLLAFFLWSFHKLPHIYILFGSHGSSKYLFWEKRIPLQPFQNSSFSLCGHILSITNLCCDRLFSALSFHSPPLSKKKKKTSQAPFWIWFLLWL